MARRLKKNRRRLFSRSYDRKHDRIYKRIIIVCAVLLALMYIVNFIRERNITNPFNNLHQSAFGSEHYGIDAEVDKALQGYRNFIIYGVDNNGKSDIIILASENKETKEITLTSINRDTYLECESGKFHKANRGYAWGGMDQGLWEINHNLDLNCRDAIALDWDAVERLVDRVDGVDVEITKKSTLDYFNTCVPADKQLSGLGKHHLDGEQVVAYCRMRKDSNSFVRGERNVDVFSSMFELARELPKAETIKIYKELKYDIDSNVNEGAVRQKLYSLGKNDIVAKNSWPENYETWWAGYYYYVPRTLESEVIELHEKLFDQKDYQPTEHVMKVSEKIEKRLKDGTLSREP